MLLLPFFEDVTLYRLDADLHNVRVEFNCTSEI